jgi:dTDP-4-amino-4,6-dideoxygalactose transaminase
MALQLAAKSLDMNGKVLCTPFTFVATLTSLLWVGVQPVLVDIEDEYLTIDPDALEGAVSDDITGIVGVHVYGNPCDVNRIDGISKKHGIPVLYDAAHVFDATLDGTSILGFGDASATSFHATKLFNTCEGGAIIANRAETSARISRNKNFGIVAEDKIEDIGINAKMSELNAAFGLAVLERMNGEKSARRQIVAAYNKAFKGHDKIRVVGNRPGLNERLQYYVIRIPNGARDAVYIRLREKGIYARRYFSPLLSGVPAVCDLLDNPAKRFPVAERAAKEVLALPLHSGLTMDDAVRISREVISAVYEER